MKSENCAEIKRLIRFDPKEAIATSREKVNWLAKKYSDKVSYPTIKIEQLRADSELLKWCTKALMYDVEGTFSLNEIDPLIE